MADRLTQLQDAVNSVRPPLPPLPRGQGARHGHGNPPAALSPQPGLRTLRTAGMLRGRGRAAGRRRLQRWGRVINAVLIGAGSSRTSSATPSECCSSAGPPPPSATSRRQ